MKNFLDWLLDRGKLFDEKTTLFGVHNALRVLGDSIKGNLYYKHEIIISDGYSARKPEIIRLEDVTAPEIYEFVKEKLSLGKNYIREELRHKAYFVKGNERHYLNIRLLGENEQYKIYRGIEVKTAKINFTL